METIRVEREKLVVRPLWWQKEGLQQTATGYGSKLSTRYMMKYNNKVYRVYCICWSNCGSEYIIVKGERVFLNII
jgi:hypothetical protein